MYLEENYIEACAALYASVNIVSLTPHCHAQGITVFKACKLACGVWRRSHIERLCYIQVCVPTIMLVCHWPIVCHYGGHSIQRPI